MSGAVASAPAQGRPSVAAPLGTSWRPLSEGPRPPTRLRASAATAVRARARADLELVTHLRIGASGRCARKPWIQAACFAASAPELGLAGWLPRLLGTVLCEFPLGECGACACYEARLFSRRGSSFERDARPLRRASAVHRSRNLVWTLLTRLRGARLLEFRGGSSPPRRRDARPALSRISFGLRMEYHSADCASNRLCARAFYNARAVSLYCVTLSEFAPLQASCLRVWNARKSRPHPKAGALTTSEPRLGGTSGYLVDPASSHMLVSKIKPCMSKYKRLVL